MACRLRAARASRGSMQGSVGGLLPLSAAVATRIGQCGGDRLRDLLDRRAQAPLSFGVESCVRDADRDRADWTTRRSDQRGAEARHTELRLAVLDGPAARPRDLELLRECFRI